MNGAVPVLPAGPRRSIRARLIAAFFGLALGPLLALALFLLPYSVYTRLDASLLRQDEAARRVTQDVAALFGEAENALRAALGEVQAYRLRGLPLLLRLDALIADGHRFAAVSLVDALGVETARAEYDAVVAPGDRRDLHGLEPVARALNTGATAYGPAEFDAETGEPTMLVVLPAPSPDRRGIEGALVGRLRLKPIWHVVGQAWAVQGLDAYVVDSVGRVIAHRNPSVVLGGRRVALPLPGGLTRGLDGGLVARAAAERTVGGEPLTTVVEVPAADALEPTLRLLGVILALLLGGVAVAALLVRRARRGITRPLRALVETVQAISAGDLTRTAEARRNDEIGDLARAFNEMTARLRALIDAQRRLNEELEARVAHRTAELAASESRLRAARDDAELANRAKSEFLSSMSHELRTPLNAILGFAQLLEMDAGRAASPKQGEYVQFILRAGRHLLSLIEDVLDLAKIEAGRIELAVEPVALAEVIEEAMGIVGPTADSAGVALVDEAGADAPAVMGDRRRVCQALVNLLSNAVKYNRPGGRATVAVDASDPARPRVLVGDTGRGIPDDRLGELFEPFNRLNAERSAIEGTGIGLAITRRMIEAMGGEVGVSSQEGVGSTFWIVLPGVR